MFCRGPSSENMKKLGGAILPVYLDLGVLRYVSRIAFGIPVHSTKLRQFLEHSLSAFVSSCNLFACQYLFKLA